MGTRIEVYAGTAGHSAWFSDDMGETWVHPNSHSGMYLEARVWTFCGHPKTPDELYAGTDMGLFRWSEKTVRWTPVASPMHDIWALAQDPDDPRILYAGTRPAGFFRSNDAGASWHELNVPGISKFSEINMGATRVTQILVEPGDAHVIWATVEIGGIYRSDDGGRSWVRRDDGLISADVHGIACIRNASGATILFATTNRGLHRSEDEGRTWVFQELDSPWQYTRAIVPRADSDATLFLTNGDGPPGSTGILWRSTDYGETWKDAGLPPGLNSTPWCVATHPSNPEIIFLASNLGQIYRSIDGGDTWLRLPHEFGEVRSFCWRPINAAPDRPAHSITIRPPAGSPPAQPTRT
ncbi:WD40/YVTN/BNR-like repeat-containing protein [Paralcaligenes ginsengisoli]